LVTRRNSIAGDAPKPSGERGLAEAESGMAAMSELFKEKDSELYMGAGDRERD
jgi:phosphomethylpyrimidine synthase